MSYIFWEKWFKNGGVVGDVGHCDVHEKIFDKFIGKEKCKDIIIDFGCGPICGFNRIANDNSVIGVDVLAGKYKEMIIKYKMHTFYEFVDCSERKIPLESNSANIVYSANAIDHCVRPYDMIEELIRILKGDGSILMIVNIEKRKTLTEPTTICADEIKRYFKDKFNQCDIIECSRGPIEDWYSPLINGTGINVVDESQDYLIVIKASNKKCCLTKK